MIGDQTLKNRFHFAGRLLLAAVSYPAAQAAAISFTNAGITCVNSTTAGACSGSTHNIWNTGDFIQQTFTLPGLTSVGQLGLSLNPFNGLAAGQAETWNITINSTTVGSFATTGPAVNTLNQTFNFASIAGIGGGTDYAVRFTVVSPGVPSGNGTLGLPGDQTQSGTLHSAVPEPSSIGLGLLGLAALGLRRRVSRS